MLVDDSFPRGGRKITPSETIKRKPDDNLFSFDKPPKAKKPKKDKKIAKVDAKSSEDSWQAGLKLSGTLSYNRIQEGMLVLGCVRQISNLAIQIEFPGLTFGHANITCISDAFTDIITKQMRHLKNGKLSEDTLMTLNNVVELGQLVSATILSVQNSNKGYEVQVSINPKHVNAERGLNYFKKGAVIWASVAQELDHGYELSVGVKNCRVFLPHKNIDKEKKYVVGEPLFCVVHKSEQSDSAATLTVSSKMEHLNKVQVDEDDFSLNNVSPGLKLELTVDKVSHNGVKGKVLQKGFAYLDKTQLFSKTRLDKITEGSLLSVHVLFVEPMTKVVYVTLKNLSPVPAGRHEPGKILSTQVTSISPKGIYVKLGKNECGFITNKRLLSSLKISADDLAETIKRKYPVKSHHTCRILDYNRLEQTYVCTFEAKVLKEKVFHTSDLVPGQKVDVKIEKIVPAGLAVTAGHVHGFVPNLHLSNVRYSDKVKQKYAALIGKSVKARVLNVVKENNNVIFTLKAALIEGDADNCLTDIGDAQPGSQRLGYVLQTRISGVTVAFFGDAKGWIWNKDLNADNPGPYTDPRDYFFRGQVVNVWIKGIKNGRLELSVSPTDGSLTSGRDVVTVGKLCEGEIVGVTDPGLEIHVAIGNRTVKGLVPTGHLTNDPTLDKQYLKMFSAGDRIDRLTCIKAGDCPTFSRREGRLGPLSLMSRLKVGMIVKCWFEKRTNQGIYVSPCLRDHGDLIFIPARNVDDLYKDQPLLAKVQSLDPIGLSIKSRDVGNNRDPLPYAVDLLTQNLADLDRVIKFGHENEWDLFRYRIGDSVTGKVSIDESGELFVTADGITGFVPLSLRGSNKLTDGSDVTATVVDYDLTNSHLVLCLKNTLRQKINKVQDGSIVKSLEETAVAEILWYSQFYALGLLKDRDCNRQLVYLPIQAHENDFAKSLRGEYQASESKLKVIVTRKVGTRIVGVSKRFVLSLEAKKLKVKAPKVKKEEEPVDLSEDEEMEEVLELRDEKRGSSGPVLSGVASFFGQEEAEGSKMEESSSDEEDSQEGETRQRKKLTPAERVELARKEEERISKIERELADSESAPVSAEQFDRLLLANPNSSELWLKYISMHVASTELEKARAVGKRALETINMTVVKEKFNIWIALLNLENMYGSRESFDNLFQDAVKFNDSLEMYLSVIKMLASSGKLVEMEEKIKKVRAKEKQNTKMWLEIGQVYYGLNKYKEARNVKDAALKSITEKKRQFDLIVRFSIMEFQHGELDQAVANFETILETCPSKVNIWIIYVDQLVKKKEVEMARKVLERAVSQRLPLKSMRAVFQKFITFEEQNGTPDTVGRIKDKAKEFITQLK